MATSTRAGVFLAQLAAELPADWTVSEGATFVAPSGIEVHTTLTRAPDGWSTAELIDEQERRALEQAPGIADVTSSSARLWAGPAAQARRFTFDQDGERSIGRLACAVVDGLALVVSSSWPESGPSGDGDVEAMLAGLRVLDAPVEPVVAGWSPVLRHGPERRGTVDPSAWSTLQSSWALSSPSFEPVAVTRWSTAELSVVAHMTGAASFPTAESFRLGALTEEQARTTVDAVVGSFVARGLLQVFDGAETALVGPLADLMDIALFPDLTVSVEIHGSGGHESWWFGLRPDLAALVRVVPDGSRDCGAVEPGELVERLLELGAADGPTAPGAPRTLTLDELLRADGDVERLVSVVTGWRDGDTIVGGQVLYATGADGASWLAEPKELVVDLDADGDERVTEWSLRPADQASLRRELLAHLPGSDDEGEP